MSNKQTLSPWNLESVDVDGGHVSATTAKPGQKFSEYLLREDQLPKGRSTPKEKPVPPTEQLRIALDRAKEEGFQFGYQDGFSNGQKLGKEKGRAEGQREAHEEATQKYSAEIAEFRAELEKTLASIQGAVNDWFDSSEKQLNALAMQAVEGILAVELTQNQDACLALVREALGEVTNSSKARIRVNPFCSETVRSHRDEILSAVASLRDIEVVNDDSVRHGCIVETDGGVIDATVETRLKLLKEGFGDAA